MGEDDKSTLSHMQQVKKLENWEEQLLHDHHTHHHHQQQQQQINPMVESGVKQENSLNYGSSYGHGNVDFHGVKPNTWSNPMIPVSSPNSCISSLSNNMLDFSTTMSNKTDGRHPPPDRSSEVTLSLFFLMISIKISFDYLIVPYFSVKSHDIDLF